MPVREWLRNACLKILADTMADINGLIEEIRSEHDGGRMTPAVAKPLIAQRVADESRSRAA